MTEATSLSNLSDDDTDYEDTDLSSALMQDDDNKENTVPPQHQPPSHDHPLSSPVKSQPHKRHRAAPSSPSPPSPLHSTVTLDVGGYVYRTTAQTLLSIPSTFFTGLLSSPSFSSPAFIDRDGQLFRHVLNFMRDRSLPAALSPQTVSELQAEAAYYLLDDLKTALQHRQAEQQMQETERRQDRRDRELKRRAERRQQQQQQQSHHSVSFLQSVHRSASTPLETLTFDADF